MEQKEPIGDIENVSYEGFISSSQELPPFKILVIVKEPWGAISKVIFHESENDGYDFKKEKPMRVHLINNFEYPIYWRLPEINETFS